MNVKIERLDDFGRGIAFIDNKICFIENALPGEIVKIEIIKESKKYLEAKVMDYIKRNSNREESKCPYFSKCGGCNFWHLNYQNENTFKEEKVKNLLTKFSSIDKEIVRDIKYHKEQNYRNKIVLHGKNNILGLYQKGTNEIVEIEECLLVSNKINQLIKELKRVNKNITEAIIKISNNEESIMLKINGEVSNIEELRNQVDVLIINNKLLSKKSSITTEIGNKVYLESINSFFQINKTLTKDLYDAAFKVVEKLRPKKVLDLYCGTGTIGIYVSEYCQEIIGIDNNESNIRDANMNKELNKVKNIRFICDKVENRIDSFNDIDVVIVDPPRAGLDSKTIENLLRISAKAIIYISCDPVTLVRDLDKLNEQYKVESITPYNMFPKTYHIECVSILIKKD